MNTSPLSESVQSTSKFGSDFSIERILSSDDTRRHTSNQSDDGQIPNWLCCTRYRPPRLPRAVKGGGCRARRSGRHARVPFTAAQAAALEAAYARAPYLAPPALRALAAALHLRDDRIKIWFQNRRARERREKCSNIAPPLAVTLPPTTNAQMPWMTSSCSWTPLRDIPSHPLNTNTAMKRDESVLQTPSVYEKETVLSERSSLSESSEEDRSDFLLDIETIED